MYTHFNPPLPLIHFSMSFAPRRGVCTRCGFADRPRRKSASANVAEWVLVLSGK